MMIGMKILDAQTDYDAVRSVVQTGVGERISGACSWGYIKVEKIADGTKD